MSLKIPVNTTKAPKALPGIYNQAIVANGMVFCSGVVALDSDTMKIKEGDVKAHTVRNLMDIIRTMSAPDYLTLQIA